MNPLSSRPRCPRRRSATLRSFLRQLTAEYVLSRYPNATDAIPAKLYDRETAEDYLARTAEVLDWVRSLLNP